MFASFADAPAGAGEENGAAVVAAGEAGAGTEGVCAVVPPGEAGAGNTGAAAIATPGEPGSGEEGALAIVPASVGMEGAALGANGGEAGAALTISTGASVFGAGLVVEADTPPPLPAFASAGSACVSFICLPGYSPTGLRIMIALPVASASRRRGSASERADRETTLCLTMAARNGESASAAAVPMSSRRAAAPARKARAS
ncbi:MAG: hypothetical protein JOZ88_05695 [Hyphomicrobiales bacterium]|nr:hypothetical protein [Hyphomicrobiales bacterium]